MIDVAFACIAAALAAALFVLAERRRHAAQAPFRTARCVVCGRLVRPQDGHVEAGEGGPEFVCHQCWILPAS